MILGSLFDGAGTACLAAKLIGITPVQNVGERNGVAEYTVCFRKDFRRR